MFNKHVKAIQSFNSETYQIENGIYLGDFAALKFFGDFTFDLKKSKLEFDFNRLAVFGFNIELKKGEAAKVSILSINLPLAFCLF